MSRRQLYLLLAVGVAAIALLVWLNVSLRTAPAPRDASSATPRPTPGPGSGDPHAPMPMSSATPSPDPAGRPSAPASPLATAINALLDKMRHQQATPADFEALRRMLLAADPAVAIAAITEFLQSGADAASGIEMAVGPGGTLAGAPSMRVFLMDLLGQISSKSGSDAAAKYARTVLETKTSPDEWAVSLRNVAWREPAATAYLAGKMREMLREPAWTSAPSPGLLEAFDIIVYTGDPTFIPELAEMARGGLSELQRAALVALDRMADNSPLAVMSFLNANPAELADKPLLRADYYAKADLGQREQLAAVEAHLSRGDVTLDEKAKIVQALASPASFVTDGLVAPPTPAVDDAARRAAYTSVLAQWVTKRRFPELLGVMQQVQAQMALQ